MRTKFSSGSPASGTTTSALRLARRRILRAGRGYCLDMATEKQRSAAKRNVKKAQAAAKSKRSLANMPRTTKTALGKQGAAAAQRKRTGGSSPKTRAELYEIAQNRGLPGRSKMGRDELAHALHTN
jgi:hypothetical protein